MKKLNILIAVFLVLIVTFALTGCMDKETDNSFFSFKLLGDGTYEVSAASGEVIPESIFIPTTYNDVAVTKIAENGFSGENCYDIRYVVIKSDAISVGASAFANIENLKEVVFYSNEFVIGDNAFFGCIKLSSLKYPYAESGEIGASAFSGCAFKGALEIDEGILKIGDFAFFENKISSVSLSKDIAEIGDGAFACATLESFSIDEKNSSFAVTDGCLTDKNGETVYQYPTASAKTSATVDFKSVKSYAYAYSANLTSVTLSSNVQTVCRFAFIGCKNLKNENITVSGSTSLFEADWDYIK